MKKVLAILLAAVMVLSIIPFAVAQNNHPQTNSFEVGDTEGNCYWLSANKPYYKNGADGPTDVAEGANVAYDETTGVLTLDNYDGGPIRTNDGNGDLTIVAKGVNTIHAYQFGIFAPYCDLTITSEEQAQINMSTQTNNSGGNYKFRVRFFINAPDGKNYFGPWVAIASPTLPVNTTLKVTAGSKAFTAQWGKKAVSGYQLQYSTKANFAGAATITVKNAKTYKYAVKNLKAKTVYYVRVRTYKTIAKVNYFSAWSATAKVKTK